MFDDAQIEEAYQQKFGDLPTMRGFSPAMRAAAMEVLRYATAMDQPFENDRQFFAALGLKQPPQGARL